MLHNKIKYQFVFLILACFVCISFKKEIRIYSSQGENIINDTIKPFKIDTDIDAKYPEVVLKGIIRDQLNKGTGNSINLNHIDSVKYFGTYKFKNQRQVLIYKVKLSYDLPAVWHYSEVLIVDNVNHNGYLIDLDVIEPIKVKQDSDLFYFAGRYKNRYLYGTFIIYDFKGNLMYPVFESDDAVSNYSFDCISYENDNLKLQNIDLNNDDYLDLKFSGVKNYYCNGYEQYGREEREPIKKEKITVNYYYNSVSKKWESKK